MDNHPIPQDITGFKFKIIGSMTIKQFAYVVAAGIFCTLTFVAMSKSHPFLMVPIMGIFAAAGIGLAFVPVGGRPLDKMLVYFARSIPKENQFVYKKQGIDLSKFEFLKPTKSVQQQQQPAQQQAPQLSKNEAKRKALASALRNSHFRPDDQELQYFSNLKASFDNPDIAVSTPTPLANEIRKVTPPSAQPQNIQQNNVAQAKPSVANVTDTEVRQRMEQNNLAKPTPVAPQKKQAESVDEIKKEIQDIKVAEQSLGKTEELEAKIRDLEKQLAEAMGQTATFQQQVMQQAKQVPNTPAVTPTPKEPPKAENVKSVTPQSNLSTGFPTLPDTPNIILGIVKDPRGKVLQNILVEVVDKNELPVRAFKTNALGKFIAATPLPNGVYKIYFEDPSKNHEFETVQIEMKGEIFNPLEIISIDQREKLRRELFGNTPLPINGTLPQNPTIPSM